MLSQLDTATQERIATAKRRVSDAAAALAAAQTPTEVMQALAGLEATAQAMRGDIAVRVVLNDGWSYAQLGRSLGVTRQAASKLYGPRVDAQMRRELRGQLG